MAKSFDPKTPEEMLIARAPEIDAIRTDHNDTEAVMVRAFFSGVFSSRMIDARGLWRIDVFTGDRQAEMRLAFTYEQRRQLVEALGGTMPEES